MILQKATKKNSYLRLALFGGPGSGKTFTALRLAKGMSEQLKSRIAFLDTEHGTASKYSDRFDFDVANVENNSIDNLCYLINEIDKDYNILIIDSFSHAWKELLAEVERLAETKFKGNTFRAWSQGTPKQKALVETILRCKLHLIVTMRSKLEYHVSTENGKMRPEMIGLAPEQGKGIEYEFDMLGEMNQNHKMLIVKDRTGKYQDSIIDKPSEQFGKDLLNWVSPEEVQTETTAIKPVQGFSHVGEVSKQVETKIKPKTQDGTELKYFTRVETSTHKDDLSDSQDKTIWIELFNNFKRLNYGWDSTDLIKNIEFLYDNGIIQKPKEKFVLTIPYLEAIVNVVKEMKGE